MNNNNNTATTTDVVERRREVRIPRAPGKFVLSLCDAPQSEGEFQHPREVERLARQGASFLEKIVKGLEADEGPRSGRKLTVAERKLIAHGAVILKGCHGDHEVHMAARAAKIMDGTDGPIEVQGVSQKQAAIRACQRAVNLLRGKVVPFARWARDYLAVQNRAGAPPVTGGREVRLLGTLFPASFLEVATRATAEAMVAEVDASVAELVANA
jgi:hypothetical protein